MNPQDFGFLDKRRNSPDSNLNSNSIACLKQTHGTACKHTGPCCWSCSFGCCLSGCESAVRLALFIMRPSSLGGGRILRRTLSVRLSVCPSVCPSVPLSSVTSRHLANYNDTLRAAYRTAISAAQTCSDSCLGQTLPTSTCIFLFSIVPQK